MNEKYMKAALAEAQKAYKRGDVPVGAIIVKDSKIIARAYNKRESLKDATCHAEILAIRKACKHIKDWRLNGCSIYVTLEPCAMCMGAISQARIENVYFGTTNSREQAYSPNHVEDVMSEESSTILKLFFQNRRNE